MLFVVRFTDHADKRAVREENLELHISWLGARQGTILIAGSLRQEVNAIPVGGLWVVEAHSKEEVEALYKTDPFWLCGLRKDVEILHWSKAFPGQQVLV
ncbi:MAG: YciI family protein [Pseudohongiella sp.]|nr:YciI family protein [Pseudohongiella sp.]